MGGKQRWQVADGAEGERLDSYLAARLDVPRNQTARWIRQGAVLVDGAPAKPSKPLTGGEWIDCEPLVLEQPADLLAEAGELSILHQDREIVVLDKPVGLVVHPGAGRSGGTLANRLLERFPETAAVGGPGRPGIVHRLDRETSGVLVVARTPIAYRRLSEAFAERRVEKRYLAVAYGTFAAAEGTIASPIGRHPNRRKEMTVTPAGRPAVTHYRVLDRAAGLSLLEITLETGRTHQIRVHLKAERRPLVGDPVYGEARWRELEPRLRRPLRDFPRPALHSWKLAFEHPASGERVAFEAPPPADLAALWRQIAGRFPPLEDSPPG